MDEQKYYISLDGRDFEVSRELYTAYMKGQRKERDFTHDLKKEHRKIDRKTGEVVVVPCREES